MPKTGFIRRYFGECNMKKSLRSLSGMICGALFFVSAPNIALSQGIVEGFGSDIPLSFALEQILPAGYSASYSQGVNPEMKVSWVGGDKWENILNDLAQEEGLIITHDPSGVVRVAVDSRNRPTVSNGLTLEPYKSGQQAGRYSDKITEGAKPGFSLKPSETVTQNPVTVVDKTKSGLTVAGVTTPSNASPKPVPAPTKPADAQPGIKIVPSATAEKVEPTNPPLKDTIYVGVEEPVAGGANTWNVFAGDSLENVLMDWADKSGWTVVWNSEYSYPIKASARFEGNFMDASAALIRSFNKANPPVRGEFYKGNKVLVVITPTDGHG